MIIKVNNNDYLILNKVQDTFCDVYKQKNELIDTIKSNPYVNICIFCIDDIIAGLIQYQDIYDRFELDNIYVLENYRNQRIASSMMDFMIEEGINKKIKNITLEVREDNTNAIAMYKKYGFTAKAIRKNYYNNCDGILMEKEMR